MEWIHLDKVNQDWISILIFSNLFLLSLTKWKYDRKFTSFFKSIDPSIYFNNYGNNFFFNRLFGVSILFFSILNVALYLVFILNSLGFLKMDLYHFLILFFFLILIGFLSYSINSFVGGLFKIKRETLVYNFSNLRSLFRFSILIFVILSIHHFYFINTFTFLKITFYCLVILYYINSFRIVHIFLGNVNRGKFYFILYLCTLKFTPWVFIYWFFINI